MAGNICVALVRLFLVAKRMQLRDLLLVHVLPSHDSLSDAVTFFQRLHSAGETTGHNGLDVCRNTGSGTETFHDYDTGQK